jgi:hypothetical protein
MAIGTPTVTFDRTENRITEVAVNGRPAGQIREYDKDIWTYDHLGFSLVGQLGNVQHEIVRKATTARARITPRSSTR